MLDKMVSRELKILALETINNAGSGHSGSVLSCGDILYTLYTRHLLSNGTKSMNRDRFVLSNGHACAGLYSILAGLQYFDIEELKLFRKYNGRLTGHPEIDVPGIDAATGPLGQGVANAVGMAIAESIMSQRFNLNHHTYCMVGDGCLQEGVAMEALSIAGLYKLNKFILLYDKNDVTLDGKLSDSSSDNMVRKFIAMNFNVIECNGHNIRMIDEAIARAKQSKDKPSVIIFHTIIGKDTDIAGSNKSHGKVYSAQEIDKLRKYYKINSPVMGLSEQAKERLLSLRAKITQKFEERVQNFNNFIKNDEKIEKLYLKFINNDFKFKIRSNKKDMSTREANNIVLNDIAKTQENLLVLSADLSSSTKVKINDSNNYSAKNRLGKNIAVGIREHAMGAIANGIALHGGFVVTCSTFLTFSNYMMPAIRMAGIMNLPVLFAFSHSSVYETPDGVTHIPVEQLDQLRIIPNMTVVRPCCLNECAAAYETFFKRKRPMCLSLSRGDLPGYPIYENMDKGAYLMTNNKAEINIMASGSEVSIAMQVKDILKGKLIANVISVPSLEIFDEQTKAYKNKILNKPIFVIESSTCVKYLKYTTEDKIFNVCDFGVSGDEINLKKHFGYDANIIAEKILKIIKK
ncbi:MAG: transketolase [Clostridia bacterium]|nr:transketolase [Clostridia bacterium]